METVDKEKGPRNTLGDMHNILMEQLERLNEASADELDSEIKRSEAISEVAEQVSANATNVIRAAQMRAKYSEGSSMPRMLQG